MQFDWVQIRKRLERRAGEWYLLADGVPYTTAEAIRRGKITALRGAQMRTRNTVRDETGKRFCSVWLRVEED